MSTKKTGGGPHPTGRQVGSDEFWRKLLKRKAEGLMGVGVCVPFESEEYGLILVDIDKLINLVKPERGTPVPPEQLNKFKKSIQDKVIAPLKRKSKEKRK